MSFFDWTAIGILAFFSVRSLLRGASRELFSLLALVCAPLISCAFYGLLIPYVRPHVPAAWLQPVISFGVIFIAVYCTITAAGWLLGRLLKAIRLSHLDTIGGAVVGAAKAYVLICCIIMLLMLTPRGSRLLDSSCLCFYSVPMVEFVSTLLPKPMQQAIVEKTAALKQRARASR